MNSTALGKQSEEESNFSTMVLAMLEEDAEICQNCGNVFRLVLLKTGDDYNDFGDRHCPFCGLLNGDMANMS